MRRSVPTIAGWPIVGSLFDLLSDATGFLKRAADQHGQFARARFGVFSVVIASSADLAHEVLVEHEGAFIKSYGLSIFARPLLGDGLLSSEGDLHKRQRRLMAPAFVHKRIADYANAIT